MGKRRFLSLGSLTQMLIIFKSFTAAKGMFLPSPSQSGKHPSRWLFRCFSPDVAEQYFQESLASLKDAEGTARAKFLSIQDEYCRFLQVTGQEEVSVGRS